MATTYTTTVDARILPIPQKHPTIFRTFEGLPVGEAMLLVNDHDPKPLYYQFAAERTGQFAWRYLENGPEVWQVEIRRTAAPPPAEKPAEALGCCGHSHHHHQAGPPTQILKDEHALILEALDSIERKLSALEAGEPLDRVYFEKAVQFLRTFADRCHHGKEENLLFKTMVDHGFPRQAGPIAVMLYEHETGRSFIRGIAEGAAAVGSDPGAAKRIVENGRGYIELLRSHINKENNILFPMADNVLTAEDQERLGEEFERFESEETGTDVHEAMLKLLDELKAGAK
jgi:hemerythrin-like domain-containing protein/uncharacterized protein (DUF2249 family)